MFSALFRRAPKAAQEPSAAVSFGPCILCAGQIAETDRDPLSLQVAENGGGTVFGSLIPDAWPSGFPLN